MNSIIEHSVITNNANDGLHMWNPKEDVVDNNIVRYNIIVGNRDRGINMASGVNNLFQDNIIRGSIRNRFRRSGNKIYKNSFYGMTSSCIILEQGSHDVRNNIALNCGGTAIRNDSSGSTILNNITSGKASDIFVNPEAGDFTLKADNGVGATITNVSSTSTTSTAVSPPLTPGNLQAIAK
jgi:parallel beta-helix repeat protein